MHLITPLAAGIAAAPLGTAELRQRGSGTRADYFTDFEGTVKITDGLDIDLDTNGVVEVYVDELVDVIVRDTSAALITSFTAGTKGTSAEVISTSFTGTPYGGGGSAVSEPTTQSAVNDLWITKNGAPDWDVLVNGVITTIPSALSGVAGLFFNVKDAKFGAVGDGSTDDLSAINAAIAAAQTAGGGTVFFPPGTYKITAAIPVLTKVNMLGSGTNATLIRMDAATADTLTYAGSVASDYFSFQTLSDIRFGSIQANTGAIVKTVNARLLIVKCNFGDNTFSDGNMIETDATVAASRLHIVDCEFFLHGITTTAIRVENENCITNIYRCYVTPHTTMSVGHDMMKLQQGAVEACTFFNVNCSSGTPKCIGIVSSFGSVRVTSCDFKAETSPAAVTAIHLGNVASGSRFFETSNIFKTDTKITGIDGATHAEDVSLGSARAFTEDIDHGAGGGTLSLDTDNFEVSTVTATADFTYDLGTPIIGAFHTVFVFNDSGAAAITVSPGANTRIDASLNFVNQRVAVWYFQGVQLNGVNKWTGIANPHQYGI